MSRVTTLQAIAAGVATSAHTDRGIGVEPRATTRTERPGWRSVARIASSSASGDIARHPGMRSTVHADAVRPHP